MHPKELLQKYFGYDAFRPPQEQIIDHVLSGKDTLVLMPTGGGKSLCYQLPAMMLPGLTLVVSPLISLMKDQVDGLRTAGIPSACLNSTLGAAEAARVQADVVEGRVKILYVAPERLATPAMRALLHEVEVSLIAVDEAHCISEWGHDFRPDYRTLVTLRDEFPGTPVLALTATATQQVRADIAKQLRLAGGRIFISSFDRANLHYSVAPKKKTMAQLLGLLMAHRDESVIIYRFSKKSTEELASELRAEGFSAAAYHAGMDGKARAEVQEKFIRDEIRIIVATVAFGMGINKPDVRLVVHYDLPKSVEGYYQETGRAGRDGLPSECVLFFSAGDRWKHMFFVNQLQDLQERIKAARKIEEIVRYCSDGICRRKYLLSYFGEGYSREQCGACDTCAPRARVAASPEAERAKETVSSDPGLFETLRALRKRLADDRNVPAYVIFGDRSLHDMADRKPTDREAFATIFGVGAKKLETFADAFIEAIKSYARAPEASSGKARAGDTVRTTKRLLDEKKSIEDVAKERGVTVTTILGHIEQMMAEGVNVELGPIEFDAERFETIQNAFSQVGDAKLAPVREILGEAYSYSEIQLARILLRQKKRA